VVAREGRGDDVPYGGVGRHRRPVARRGPAPRLVGKRGRAVRLRAPALGEGPAAKEALQETFIRAWRSAARYDPERPLRAWLFAILRHVVVDELRARAVRALPRQPADEPDLDVDALDRMMDGWLVEEALRRIGAQHRAVLVATVYGGRSYAEVAAKLGIPEGTARSRAFYGLRTATRARGDGVGVVRHECGLTAEDLGPYVLGQLEAAEQRRATGLLSMCASSRAEVARLIPVVGALQADVAPPRVVAPARALDRALDAVHAAGASTTARRRRRWALVAAAVLLPAALASLLRTGPLSSGRTPRGTQVTLSGSGGAGGAVRVGARAWGSALTLDVHGLTPGRTYGAWLADGTSHRLPAGTFRATARGSAHLDLASALRAPDTRTVGVNEIGGRDVLLGAVRDRLDALG